MKPQETKFTFVYNEIKQRILEGQILPGNSLLSSRMYCEQFHVSRYTINHVFEALREEGLIEIQPRLAPIVVSVPETGSPWTAGILLAGVGVIVAGYVMMIRKGKQEDEEK